MSSFTRICQRISRVPIMGKIRPRLTNHNNLRFLRAFSTNAQNNNNQSDREADYRRRMDDLMKRNDELFKRFDALAKREQDVEEKRKRLEIQVEDLQANASRNSALITMLTLSRKF